LISSYTRDSAAVIRFSHLTLFAIKGNVFTSFSTPRTGLDIADLINRNSTATCARTSDFSSLEAKQRHVPRRTYQRERERERSLSFGAFFKFLRDPFHFSRIPSARWVPFPTFISFSSLPLTSSFLPSSFLMPGQTLS